MSAAKWAGRLAAQRRSPAPAQRGAPIWEQDGRDWPLRDASRFVQAAGLCWHVQELGEGPVALLIHGTGAATHSWRGLAPLLATRLRVVAPDLPGHGFTELPPKNDLSLQGMAGALRGLLRTLDAEPALVIGHSAGAAILARMCLDGAIAPRRLVSLNGALLPFRGWPGHIFSPLAKLLALTGLVPKLFARRASDRAVVERLLRDTGSRLDPEGVEYYARLVRRPRHVEAAFGMMANWDLDPLERQLHRLKDKLVLITGLNDRTIRPSQARRVHKLVPGSTLIELSGLGHLAHEERPDEVAGIVARQARLAGVLPDH